MLHKKGYRLHKQVTSCTKIVTGTCIHACFMVTAYIHCSFSFRAVSFWCHVKRNQYIHVLHVDILSISFSVQGFSFHADTFSCHVMRNQHNLNMQDMKVLVTRYMTSERQWPKHETMCSACVEHTNTHSLNIRHESTGYALHDIRKRATETWNLVQCMCWTH